MPKSTYSCKFLNEFIRRAQRCQSNLLGELSEGGVSKKRDMTDQLVDHIRLWSVEGLGAVADVLGGVEHAESEAGQEVARREQASYGPEGESSCI